MRIFLLFLLLIPFGLIAQTPEAGELFQIRTVTTAEMNAVLTPSTGTMVYNTDVKAIFSFDGSSWRQNTVSSTIILNRGSANNILPTATNTFFDFPLDASHIQVNQGSAFTVVGTGKVRVNETGIYQLSAALSTSNLPAGDRKYIISASRNGSLIGYLSRGSVTLPSGDFWGSSGLLVYSLSAGDVINFRYVINAGGATLNAAFVNASTTKL